MFGKYFFIYNFQIAHSGQSNIVNRIANKNTPTIKWIWNGFFFSVSMRHMEEIEFFLWYKQTEKWIEMINTTVKFDETQKVSMCFESKPEIVYLTTIIENWANWGIQSSDFFPCWSEPGDLRWFWSWQIDIHSLTVSIKKIDWKIKGPTKKFIVSDHISDKKSPESRGFTFQAENLFYPYRILHPLESRCRSDKFWCERSSLFRNIAISME